MDRTEFLRSRKTGIGGSDVASCLGLSPWRTPVQVWEDKTGRSTPDLTSDAAHFGTILEDIVAKEFSLRTGMKVQRFYDIRSTPKDLWELHQEQIAERQLIDLIGIEAYLKRIQDELDSTKKERESNELPF